MMTRVHGLSTPDPAASARNQRAIRWGLIILVPSLLWVYGVQPYRRSLANMHEQTETERAALERDRKSVHDLGSLPSTTAILSTQLRAESPRLFSVESDLAATGELAEYVGGLAVANNVQIQQLETRAARPLADGVQALPMELRAEGDIAGVLPFLHALETGDKLVRVSRLTVERPRGAADTSKAVGSEVLSVSATIYGYRLTNPELASGAIGTSSGGSSPYNRNTPDLASLDAVIDKDAFTAARSRPSPAYQLVSSSTPAKAAITLPPPIRLIGTVVSPKEPGFAMCQLGANSPRVVRIGGVIGGYTLRTLTRGRAVFSSPTGDPLELHTPQPGV